MRAEQPTLSIVIDENRIRSSVIESGLRSAGYEKLTFVHDTTGIARGIAEIEPDVIVIDLGNPNRDMLENMFQLSRAVRALISNRQKPGSVSVPMHDSLLDGFPQFKVAAGRWRPSGV